MIGIFCYLCYRVGVQKIELMEIFIKGEGGLFLPVKNKLLLGFLNLGFLWVKIFVSFLLEEFLIFKSCLIIKTVFSFGAAGPKAAAAKKA